MRRGILDGAVLVALVGLSGTALPVTVSAQVASPPASIDNRAFRDCDAVCPEMVSVPPGKFVMGSPDQEPGRIRDEGPRHKVSLSRPFAVGRFEVTFDEWDACVADGGCVAAEGQPAGGGDAGWGRGRRPAINVSWNDAQAYVAWISKRTRKPYRLLSEAEWEYVARAGAATAYPSGDTISPKDANFQDSGLGQTRPVGSYAANAFGLSDLNGNVWEWVEDCYTTAYDTAPADGTANLAGDCGRRMLRGGAWNTPARFLRSAARGRNKIDFRDVDFGFRVARDLP